MRVPSRLFKVIAGVLVLCAVGLYAVSSPRVILKHALHIQSIPKSVRNLKMGSDVWTDEVRCFYLTIAPDDFTQLLVGRNYRTNSGPFETETMHMSPGAKVSGNICYRWQIEDASCDVSPITRMGTSSSFSPLIRSFL